MAQRTLLKRVATLVAGAVLFAQLAVAAYVCPMTPSPGAAGVAAMESPASATMPGCDQPMGTLDPASPNLCAEHCKQGQQSDRTGFGMAVPPALLHALYATAAAPVPAGTPHPDGAWLSALVAASPPHAIAHCVLRI